jgi:hypothetical protein
MTDVATFFPDDLLGSMPSLDGAEYVNDFDREFSQWFDPDTGVAGFDMK